MDMYETAAALIRGVDAKSMYSTYILAYLYMYHVQIWYIYLSIISHRIPFRVREKRHLLFGGPLLPYPPQGEDGKLRGVVPLFGILQVVRFD